MEGRCEKHQFEPVQALCRTCGGEFCADCLVYSYGRGKPPYCVSCALAAAGVRSTAHRPVVRSKREIRKQLREERKAAKAAAKARPAEDIDLDLAVAAPLGAEPDHEPAGGPAPTVTFEFEISDDGEIVRSDGRAS